MLKGVKVVTDAFLSFGRTMVAKFLMEALEATVEMFTSGQALAFKTYTS
jgi:hypothetical protein